MKSIIFTLALASAFVSPAIAGTFTGCYTSATGSNSPVSGADKVSGAAATSLTTSDACSVSCRRHSSLLVQDLLARNRINWHSSGHSLPARACRVPTRTATSYPEHRPGPAIAPPRRPPPQHTRQARPGTGWRRATAHCSSCVARLINPLFLTYHIVIVLCMSDLG